MPLIPLNHYKVLLQLAGNLIGFAGRVVDDALVNENNPRYRFPGNREKDGKTLDDIYLIAAEADAEDIEDAGEEVIIYTEPTHLAKTREEIKKNGLTITTADLIRRPIVNHVISDTEAAKKALDFLDKLDEMDDVQKVYANLDIPDSLAS